MTVSSTTDLFQIEYFERAIKNGLYDVAEKEVDKKKKLILRTMKEHPHAVWTKKWLTRKILEGQRATLRYQILVTNILELKYGVGERQGQIGQGQGQGQGPVQRQSKNQELK